MPEQPHILIVDDDQQMLDLVQMSLSLESYRLSTANCAADALKMLKEGAPVDLLITDVMMPVMTGIQLIEKMKAGKIFVPVLAMTGYGEKEVVVELLRRGCNDFIDKPFTRKTLLSTVKNLLKRSARERSAELQKIAAMEKEKALLLAQIDSYLSDIGKLEAQIKEAFAGEAESNEPDAATTPAEFQVEERGDLVVIRPNSNLDERVADVLRALLVERIDQGKRKFHFDLSAVHTIDSLCFSIFLVFAKMLHKLPEDKKLSIGGAGGELRHLFQLTHMDDIYPFTAEPGA